MTARKAWPPEVKAQALALYASDGGPAASEQTGVPQTTIRQWARRTIASVEMASGTELVPAKGSAPWAQQRSEILGEIGDLVKLALSKTRDAFAAGRLRDARDGAVAAAVLIDKGQLLAGSATSRSESFSISASPADVQRQIEELERELGHR